MRWGLAILVAISVAFASPLSGYIDKQDYVVGEDIIFAGTVASTSAETVNATITNSTGLVTYSEVTSDGGSSNKFSGTIAANFQPGPYTLTLSTTTDSISFNFSVIIERVEFHAITINATKGAVFVNTSSTISDPDLVALSKSGTVHYGNATLGGKLYHFALIDQGAAGRYDTVYVDDDANFSLYSNQEDNGTQPLLEKIIELWKPFQGYTLIDAGEGGDYLLFAGLREKPPAVNENATFLVAARTAGLLGNYPMDVSLVLSNGTKLKTVRVVSSAQGIGSVAFNLTSTGEYFIDINGSVVAGLVVESFKLLPKITDTSNNPQFTFGKDAVVRVGVASKDASGNAVSLSSLSAILFRPDGTSASLTLKEDPKGNYYADVDLTGAPSGAYSVEFTGTYGGDTQKVTAGFEVRSRHFEIMAINIQMMDVMDKEGAVPNYFPPNDNITIAAFFSDISKGGMFGPPETWSLIKLDNVTGKRCSDIVKLEEVRDASGRLYRVNHTIVNISTMAVMMGATGEQAPPPQIEDQCGVIIWDNNTLPTGTYTVTVSLTYDGVKYQAADTFSIQRYYAFGYPVDSKGAESWFTAPNSTAYLRVVIKDMATNREVNRTYVKDVRIVGMERLFPVQEDVFNATLINDSYSDGIISFRTPLKEGFFQVEFKFFVNESPTSFGEGRGEGFIDLKKYIIFSEPSKNTFSPDDNITLTVHVYDVSKGAYLDFMSGSCTSCAGLVVNVSRIFNDFSFAPIPSSSYSVETGTITNSSNPVANVTISFGGQAETGFYGVDFKVTSPSGDEYFGWGWFEVRNFYVNLEPAIYNASSDNASSGEFVVDWSSGTVAPGGAMYLVPTAYDPATGLPLSISSVSIKEVRRMEGFPVPVSHSSQVLTGTVVYPWGPQSNVRVLNISGITKDGYYEAVAEVTTGKGTDKGRGWFQVASFFVNAKYRPGDMFGPPTYARSENLSVEFTAFEGESRPHNFSSTGCAEPTFAFKMGEFEPIKLSVPYLLSVQDNQCNVSLSLSTFSSGEYSISFKLTDDQNRTKEEEVFIRVGGAKAFIPKMYEVYLWSREDSKVDVFLDNMEDRCANDLMLSPDGANWTGEFSVSPEGEWQWYSGGTRINLTSNGTNLWVYEEGNGYVLSGGAPNDTFQLSSDPRTWEVRLVQNDNVKIRHAFNGVCGSYWNESGGGGYYTIFLPAGLQPKSHGLTWLIRSEPMSPAQEITAFMVSNGTHVWVNESSNLSASQPLSPGGTFTDAYGNIWEVKGISGSQITLGGRTILPNGYKLNVSLSSSGIIVTGTLDEQFLGEWDPYTGMFVGADINSNGNNSDRFAVALIDNGTRYNTLAYSLIPEGKPGWDVLNNTISLDQPPQSRRIGKLTFLSVGSRNDVVRFYGDTPGDWAFLGDFRVGDTVRVPVYVTQPNGTALAGANISVERLLADSTYGRYPRSLSAPFPNATTGAEGLAEVEINLSKQGVGAGRWLAEITISTPEGTEKLEEWKLPNFETTAYLYQMNMGNATYIAPEYRMQALRFTPDALRLYTVNLTGKSYPQGYPAVTQGVAAFLSNMTIVTSCPAYQEPADAWLGENHTYSDPALGDYYFFETSGNSTKLWVSKGNCNFAAGTVLSEGEEFVFGVGKSNFTLRVINATMNFTTIGVEVGNSKPISVDYFEGNPSPVWYLAWFKFNGENYSLLMVNGTEQVPLCGQWPGECVKAVRVSRNSSFTSAPRVRAGENFTGTMYIGLLGPGPWNDIIVLNGSSPVVPAVDIWLADSNNVSIFVINESEHAYDLDGTAGDTTYYAVAFDEFPNGVPEYSTLLVDDDLEITQPDLGNGSAYLDFYGAESGRKEIRGNTPQRMWEGDLNFNESGGSWESTWRVRALSDRGMLLQRDSWTLGNSENITIVLRVYDFDGKPIAGSPVEVLAVRAFTPGGFSELVQGTDYTFYQAPFATTDSQGYALLEIGPATSWQDGDYSIEMVINATAGAQKVEAWLHVGGWGGGP